MKSLHDLKPHFLKLLKPLANTLARQGVVPLQVMLISMGLSIFAGLIMAAGAPTEAVFLILPFVLAIRLCLNATDELLVQAHKKGAKIVLYLDELGDALSDIFLYLPFLFIPDISQVLVIFTVFAAVFTEFAGVLGLEVGNKRRYEGPMGKTDRALAFSIVAIVYGLGLLGVGWVNFLLTIIFLAQALTVYNRVLKAVTK